MDPACACVPACVRPCVRQKKGAFKATKNVWVTRKRKKNWEFWPKAEGRRTSHTVHDEAEGQMVHMIVQ